MNTSDKLHIISGGPGSGKSSLLDALQRGGYKTMPEAGRAIIQDQVAIGGTAVPWADRMAFAELMLDWELRSYHEACEFAEPVFFDRGVPDVIGYLRVCSLDAPEHMHTGPPDFGITSGFSWPLPGGKSFMRTLNASNPGMKPWRRLNPWCTLTSP